MKVSTECREYLDFTTLSPESFAYMLKGDVNRVIEDYEKDYSREFDRRNTFKVEIDYDYSPQDIRRYIEVNDNFIENAIKAFESIKSSKNFEQAFGWKIDYEVDKNGKMSFSPIIYITFDKEYTEKLKKESEAKAREIVSYL